ncbi:MAG TPA: aldo/keto reductase [Opitutaceae bacterium]|nr:aldo/keto reductase [Opitutaceae bacterium]
MTPITRRDALRAIALLTATRFAAGRAGAAEPAAMRDKLGVRLPERDLGRTGLKVSMLTCGGSHVGRPAEAEAQRIIEAALEGGVRTFETAQLYQNGGSEERYGKFLTPKYREHVQIFTKTMATDARTAESHLEGSLRRMKIDQIDLWQMHDIASPEDVDERLRGGVLDVMQKAKASGKVRHIGFTGHATWHAHAHLLKQTDVFETCLMPINVADPFYESFILNILPALTERKMGVLAMKTLAAGDFLRGRGGLAPIIPDLVSIEEAFRFVWSLPVSTLVSGMGLAAHVRENAGYAARFKPLDEAQRAALIARVAEPARTGRLEANFKIQGRHP